MSELQPIFEQVLPGKSSGGKDVWVDLGVIPSGKSIWFGYATFIAEDKDMQFEVRCNHVGFSDGTEAHTDLFDFSGAPTGVSVDRDFYRNGATALVSEVSTGVEHWWIRMRAASGVVGNFDYIFYYTLY